MPRQDVEGRLMWEHSFPYLVPEPCPWEARAAFPKHIDVVDLRVHEQQAGVVDLRELRTLWFGEENHTHEAIDGGPQIHEWGARSPWVNNRQVLQSHRTAAFHNVITKYCSWLPGTPVAQLQSGNSDEFLRDLEEKRKGVWGALTGCGGIPACVAAFSSFPQSYCRGRCTSLASSPQTTSPLHRPKGSSQGIQLETSFCHILTDGKIICASLGYVISSGTTNTALVRELRQRGSPELGTKI